MAFIADKMKEERLGWLGHVTRKSANARVTSERLAIIGFMRQR